MLAVFDISQPSAKKRFYVLDFKSGQVTAHYAAHGRDNGPKAKAIKFKGFQMDLDMVPLGPLKTAHSEVMDPYKTIVDRYDGTVYPNMIVVVLDGVTSYNNYISHTPPYKWIIHPNWYTTAAFRAKNNGVEDAIVSRFCTQLRLHAAKCFRHTRLQTAEGFPCLPNRALF